MTTALSNSDIIVLTLREREYEIVPFLKRHEVSISGDEMVERAVQLDATLGEEEGSFIYTHQAEIPAELREIAMVFIAWRGSVDQCNVACVNWVSWRWGHFWISLDNYWDDSVRLVRRRKPVSMS